MTFRTRYMGEGDSKPYAQGVASPAALRNPPSARKRSRLKYDTPGYRALRARLRRLVDAGGVVCVRCGELIEPGSPFDVGHDDLAPDVVRGPEHRKCNRATSGRRKDRRSREW